MSQPTVYPGKEYLDDLYAQSGEAIEGVMQTVKGNQFEVARILGEIIAVHDTQDALLFRTAFTKTGKDTRVLRTMIGQSVDTLRSLRTAILTLGIDENSEGAIEFALGEIHTGADIIRKELEIEELV